MKDETYTEKALRLVAGQLNLAEKLDYELKITWCCKALENWKVIISDISKGGNFYEVTYSGVNKDTNIDSYIKENSVRIKD